ncbi:Signal peptidase complex catalytic subunit [Tulasnella sp. 417]|nr:Signal peptidase complex catalytic subunit [Tulasnella sp. 417]
MGKKSMNEGSKSAASEHQRHTRSSRTNIATKQHTLASLFDHSFATFPQPPNHLKVSIAQHVRRFYPENEDHGRSPGAYLWDTASELAPYRAKFPTYTDVSQSMLQALNFATVITTGLMIWKGLGLALNNESPIVVVLSESMEPAFARGDLLFLHNPRDTPFEVGDITVYKKILTKGDNNYDDDLGLYNGREWLDREHIVGKVRGFIPYVGYVTIAMNDFPWLKYALIGILGLLALFQRE